jgi:hypothetical protein
LTRSCDVHMYVECSILLSRYINTRALLLSTGGAYDIT